MVTQEEVSKKIPLDAFEYNGHSYKVYSDVNMTWEEAKAFCESLGGYLVTITDPAEKLEVNISKKSMLAYLTTKQKNTLH